MFKAGRYRGYASYISAAKDKHIELTGDWPKALKRAMRKTTRSVTRGIGPSRHSSALDIHKVVSLNFSNIFKHAQNRIMIVNDEEFILTSMKSMF